MQKAKRKTPQAFGGMAARNQESREDWQWAVAQIEQQLDQASLSDAAGLAAPSQQAREPSGSGASPVVRTTKSDLSGVDTLQYVKHTRKNT